MSDDRPDPTPATDDVDSSALDRAGASIDDAKESLATVAANDDVPADEVTPDDEPSAADD